MNDPSVIRPVDILLADDNDDDIVLVQESFATERLANLVSVVKDGEEALAYLRRQGKYADAPRPGLVLLDINMPKKSGLEVLHEMKQDPELRSIPAIILTTSRSEEDVVRSYAEGACSFISKPPDFAKLREVTRQFSLYWVMVARVPAVGGQTDARPAD
jgi:CheY-like chemotaxis protein